ncbi:MAG: hypothetical protein ACRYG7_05580 [Janthinobacterium lividum]
MTQNERLVLGLLSGLLVASVLVWCWKPLVATIQTAVYFLFTIGLCLTYVWWLYAKRAVRSWLAPSILLGCLLLSACLDMRVYQRAHTVSYTREEGMLSELVYYTPQYEGEGEAIALVIGNPLLGVVLLWRYSSRGQRGWQFLHYLVLLLTFYPLAAVILFSSIGTKPRYYDGAHLPAIEANSQ